METDSVHQPKQGSEITPVSRPSATLRPGGKFSSNRDIAVVQADYLALANDLEQAQALAALLEIQLSGKTNELARFKGIGERTQADLAKFEQDIDTLRRERHSLANEVQRAYAIEHHFEKLKQTHEEVKARAERLESELARERAAHMQSRTELDQLRARLENERRNGTGGNDLAECTAPGSADRELRRALETLREQLDRVLAHPAAEETPRPRPVAAAEHIEIEFSA